MQCEDEHESCAATTTGMMVHLLAGDLNTVHTAHKADEWGITLNQ